MICKTCRSATEHVFTKVVLDKYPANFDYCETCGFLSIRDPEWLAEAYSDAISAADTGAVARNLQIARNLCAICDKIGSGPYLDIGGGSGLLVRLMRDRGFDFYWSDEYCSNIYAKGFETPPSHCLAVTAFEVLEHTIEPLQFITNALEKSDTLIFTQDLFEGYPPKNWWYYSLSTGQHISFFQKRTLLNISNLIDVKYTQSLGMHIFTRNRSISPANHIDLAFSIIKKRKSLTLLDYEAIVGERIFE